jgi:hypothetical protein
MIFPGNCLHFPDHFNGTKLAHKMLFVKLFSKHSRDVSSRVETVKRCSLVFMRGVGFITWWKIASMHVFFFSNWKNTNTFHNKVYGTGRKWRLYKYKEILQPLLLFLL